MESAAAKFVGVWKLVSCESTNSSTGEVRYPYGRSPAGRIIYDAQGRMSAQLMNPDRKRVGGPPSRGATAAAREASVEDLREMVGGYGSYFGTFDVDEASATVIHHVQGSLVPSWIGTDLRRRYEFVGGDELVLTASGDWGDTRLVWRRDR